MNKITPKKNFLRILILFLSLFSIIELSGQSFTQNQVDFNGHASITNGTALSFGPDGRLYVTEYTGEIKIYTLEREAPGAFKVIDLEILSDIHNIPGHNDDGSAFSSTFRQTIGLTVLGTVDHPVFYVSSSDFRIGGGGAGGSGDVGLDTNSGVITRFSWSGTAWDVVDVVRGLPRSEENHSTNGMEYAVINGSEYLLVAQGGNTNAGGPSANFAYTTEYALAAAVLSVNLSMLEAMPVLEDQGRNYIYDIPTLDDPTRPNKNGITNPDDPGYDGVDVNDPWGGNDGLNQAMIVQGGPVQIFSPGFRNAFDLVVTQNGAVYVTDNGANGGWGGFPENEGMSGTATNNYLPSEPGSSSPSDGEKINNKDHLSLVTTNLDNYTFGSFYGGHPTPVRANPLGAGLYTNPAQTGTTGAVFRTLIYHPEKDSQGFTTDPNIGLPANWPPVIQANPVEGDWRGPGIENPDGPNDELVTTWGTNTNAITEYTASNFQGVMKGNLLAGVNTGELRRVELHPDGNLKELHSSFVSGLGGDALGLTANGDDDIFPGTIWVVTLNGKMIVLEPQDFVVCILPGDPEYDPNADNDFDGYTNQDEIDNGTDPCNGGSQPSDFDKMAGGDLISDLNDPDDDSDGIPDHLDPFQLGDPLKSGSDAFVLPVFNELFSSNLELKGYMGLGMTGMMNNGEQGPNWLNWLDRRDDPSDPNPNDILGGAIGAMTMHMTSGTAFGTSNSQEKGFQYGVQVDQSTGDFVVSGAIVNFNDPLQIYGNTAAPDGELGIFIGDGFQSDYIKFVLTKTGLVVQQEVNDIPEQPLLYPLSEAERPSSGVTFYYIIDPVTATISFEFSLDNGSRKTLGSMSAKGNVLEAIETTQKDLAVGLIGTSNQTGVEVEGTWDFLHVTKAGPYLTELFEDLELEVQGPDYVLDLSEHFESTLESNLVFTVETNSDPVLGVSIIDSKLVISPPSTPLESEITIRATDSQGRYVEQDFSVAIREHVTAYVLFRVNAGGPAIASIDENIDWQADTRGGNSEFLSNSASNMTSSANMNSFSEGVDLSVVPELIFTTERYDNAPGVPNLTYSFPVVESGFYEVRLFLGDGFSGTSQPGARIFSVALEGSIQQSLQGIDLSDQFGTMVGGVISQVVEVTDGMLDIEFLHETQNPLINGIEIRGSSAPLNVLVLSELMDQQSFEGDELDGSLVVSATGGQGNLSFEISGQPDGVTINPTNGQIGGTIGATASLESPYLVWVRVEDSQAMRDSVSFTWRVHSDHPIISMELEDLSREVGAAEENILLNDYFQDNQGSEGLIYSIVENTNTAVGASIVDSLLVLTFPTEQVVSLIKIRATDPDENYVEQEFSVTVVEKQDTNVLYRVNAGGPLLEAIDQKMDWSGDTRGNKSEFLSQAGNNVTYSGKVNNYDPSVDLTSVPLALFSSERYDGTPGAPNLTYTFPVPEPGLYTVRLYMGDGYDGTAQPGSRVFDVKLENELPSALEDLDLSALFGSMVAGVISEVVEVTDGELDIEFLHGVQNPLINGIEILSASAGSPGDIQVAQIADQVNYVGQEMDGSLTVSASGGQGNLVFSITGQPQGIVIEPTNGIISGTIGVDAYLNSPYTVAITVDDSDESSSDAVSISFMWTIHSGHPQLAKDLPDLIRTLGSDDEVINLDEYFSDNAGVEELVYSITQNSDSTLMAYIEGHNLRLVFPEEPVTSTLTVRASDGDGNFIEQSFVVEVVEQQDSVILYRVNAGGPLVVAIDNEMDWSGDTRGANSEYLVEAAGNLTYSGGINTYSNTLDLNTTALSIFNTERYDNSPGVPNMTYSFPVPEPGLYELRLYMGDGFSGTALPGQRVFDVKLEGEVPIALKGFDISATFGSMTAGVVTQFVEVVDGTLDIEFLHLIQNPLLNAIEILSVSGIPEQFINVTQPPNQSSVVGEVLDGSLQVMASGGVGDLSYSMTGAPLGVSIDPISGVISGIIDLLGASQSPYTVSIVVNDESQEIENSVEITFTWIVSNAEENLWTLKGESQNYTARHENSFVQAGDKFYLMGGRENAKTIDVYDYATDSWSSLVDSAPFEFNHFQATQYEGLIWVIGAFKTNNFPNEVPAEYIWIFNPATQQWIQGAEIPSNRRRGSAGLVVYDDKFYITGGNTIGHDGGYVAWFDQYDPKTGQWTPLEDAPHARDHFHTSVINGKLYAVGGRLSGGQGGTFRPLVNQVDVYDFASDSWSTLSSDLPTGRAGAAVANFTGKLVVIGGEVEQEYVYGELRTDALEITEAYDPLTNQWSRWGDLNYKRHGTQAIVSGEGLYTLAGSPNRGGGNQKYMEFIGVDAPVGLPSLSGVLSAQDTLTFIGGNPKILQLENSTGNLGVILNSISFSGRDAAYFEIVSGNFSEILLPSNSSHDLGIVFTGQFDNATANLHIHYQGQQVLTIALEAGQIQAGVALSSLSGSSKATLYPNPVNQHAVLKVDSSKSIKAIQIHGYNGSQLRSFRPENIAQGNGEFLINLQGLPDGMYFVRVVSENSVETIQVIKKR